MPTPLRSAPHRTDRLPFSLCLITDRHQTAGRPLVDVVRAALQGGVGAVQLREKGLADEQLYPLARELRAVTGEFGARLLINRSVELCRAVGADGVQLGIEGTGVAEARGLLGPAPLIGYSAHGVAEARSAEAAGADFVTFSPVFHTPSKAAYGPPVGLELLREACATLTIPVLALGGIKESNIHLVLRAGARGVALISDIMTAPDPAAAASSLVQTITQHDILS